MKNPRFWSAVAERSGDTAFGCVVERAGHLGDQSLCRKQSGVAASLCHRTPKCLVSAAPRRVAWCARFLATALAAALAGFVAVQAQRTLLAQAESSGQVAVDPKLELSVYLGGDGRDSAKDAAVSPQGHAYMLGDTAFGRLDPGNAPLIKHAPNVFFDTTPDIMVVKYAPDLKTVEYFATIGGTGKDEALAIAADAQGNAVILARTESFDFPTKNPIQANLRGDSDFAVLKLSANGRELIFSTYLGSGGGGFRGFGGFTSADLALDGVGQVYLAGTTFSEEFPVTDGAFQRKPGTGTPNGFVAKLAADGSRLIYATYLGASGADFAQAIAVDAAGNAFIGGTTTSADFPLVKPLNAERGPMIGGREPEELFLAKLNASGSALEFSTFLIGEGEVNALALTAQGSVVMAGQSGGGLSTTPNALQRSAAGGFVLELNPSLTAVAYSTHLGGTTLPLNLATDANGNLAVTGVTQPGALVTTHDGFVSENPLTRGAEAFVVKLGPSRNVIYSIRVGGSDTDEGRGVAILPGGDLLIVGVTKSFDFPLVDSARTLPISEEAFLARISEEPSDGSGNKPGREPRATQRYTDRNSADLPLRFYRVRELRPP